MVQKIQDGIAQNYASYIIAPFYMVLLFYCRCENPYLSCVLETSILLPPPSILFQIISTSSSSTEHSRHGPQR